jgi:hypothetical protein
MREDESGEPACRIQDDVVNVVRYLTMMLWVANLQLTVFSRAYIDGTGSSGVSSQLTDTSTSASRSIPRFLRKSLDLPTGQFTPPQLIDLRHPGTWSHSLPPSLTTLSPTFNSMANRFNWRSGTRQVKKSMNDYGR